MPLLTTKVTGQKEKKRRHLPFVICEGNVTWILMFEERYFPVAHHFIVTTGYLLANVFKQVKEISSRYPLRRTHAIKSTNLNRDPDSVRNSVN